MVTYFVFIVKASCCLSLFYLIGLLLFRNNNDFKFQRFYLLGAILLSLALPFNKVSMHLFKTSKPLMVQEYSKPVVQNTEVEAFTQNATQPIQQQAVQLSKPAHTGYSLGTLASFFYWSIAFFFFLRICYGLAYVAFYFVRSQRRKENKYTIVYHPSVQGSFSFLRWIFMDTALDKTSENQHIIKHEMVHANEYHSLDIIVIELLSAVMWFNPVIWLMRKRMQQLHEYLADEGVIKSGTDILEYQTLLVNQVAGDRLICLPSGFNQSLIKKRLAMMTTTRISKRSGYRLLTLIPLSGLIFVALSFTNKAEVPKDTKSKTNPMNVQFQKTSFNSDTIVKNKVLINNDKKVTKNSDVSVPVDLETAPPPPPPPPPSNSGTMAPPPPPPPPMNVKTPLPPSARIVTAVAPTKMNVLYLGVDNPLNIAVSGVPDDKLIVETDNGAIIKEKGMYLSRPKQVGSARIHVFAEMDGKKLHMGEMEFRVKIVPDPVAAIKTSGGIKTNGFISKKELLDAKGIDVDIYNFDFDLTFKVESFVLSFTLPNEFKIVEEVSKSDKFTEKQINEIKSLIKWQKVTIEAITVVGPDGMKRKLNPMVFTIQD